MLIYFLPFIRTLIVLIRPNVTVNVGTSYQFLVIGVINKQFHIALAANTCLHTRHAIVNFHDIRRFCILYGRT